MKDQKEICGTCISYIKCHGEEWHGKCAWDDEEVEHCSKACAYWEDEFE